MCYGWKKISLFRKARHSLKNGFYQKSVIDFSFVNKWCSSTYRIVTQSQDDQILISMVEG